MEINTGCCVGGLHTVCLSSTGFVYSFGYGNYGQLGLGEEFSISNIPIQITQLPIITQISCGYFFTICLDETGTLWSFGQNNNGQLGNNTLNNQNIPQTVANIPPIRKISCGSNHTICIARELNEIWSFGCNKETQLCVPEIPYSSVPIQTQYNNITNIATGGSLTVLQKETDFLCFGSVENHPKTCTRTRFKIGTRKSLEIPYSTIIFPENNNIVSFCCGANHVLFLDDEGSLYAIGNCSDGQLGVSWDVNDTFSEPRRVNTSVKMQKISASLQNSYAIDNSGYLWSTGSNIHGQLGMENAARSICNFSIIKDVGKVKYISNGFGKHILFDAECNIWAFGCNDYGQLGLSDYTQRNTPQKLDNTFSHIFGKMKKNISAKSARK